MSELFSGSQSLRWPTERRSFVITVMLLPLSIGVVGFFLRHAFDWSEIAILIVSAMIYVAILRGRLLGTGVRVDQRQFPELLAVVRQCANSLGLAMPEVFIREDMFAPVVAIGFSPPYSIVISSYYLPHVGEDALRFLVGRELGHVAAGHTRVTSFFMASGRDNPFVGAILGGWLRCTEYTADRAGLLCCGSIEAAVRAIVTATFHSFAPRIDHAAFAEQHREIEGDPLLRMGEWLGVSPYVTNRVRAIEGFAASPRFARVSAAFAAGAFILQPAQERSDAQNPRRLYWRRAIAFAIDFALIESIIGLSKTAFTALAMANVEGVDRKVLAHWLATFGRLQIGGFTADSLTYVSIIVYCAVLVALMGQTFGMIVMGLRVVGANGHRIGLGVGLWRYTVAVVSGSLVLPLVLSALYRRPLHDWASGARVVSAMVPRQAARLPEASV